MIRPVLGVFCALVCLSGGGALAQDAAAAEVAFVKALFAKIQPRSIRENVEYCGYLGYDEDGVLRATDPARGEEHSCAADWPEGFDPVASYHTHGGYLEDTFSELPSDYDIEGDAAEGIDGYVATPGGRLWYIDSVEMEAGLICGIGCLPMDGDFNPDASLSIAPRYSYDALVQFFEAHAH